MAYIGKTPTVGNFVKLDALTASATASYTMQLDSVNFSPESVNHMLVSLNGVIQAPTDSYTISGSTITFASALTSSDSIDFIMVYGNVLDIGTPSDNTVSLAKLTASGTKDATTFLRGDNTFATVSGTTINNNADNRVITGSGTANTLEGEANFIYNGTIVGAGANGSSSDLGVGLHIKTADTGGTVSSSADELVIEGTGHNGMTILSGTGNEGSINFGDSGANRRGFYSYDHSADAAFIGTAESIRVKVDSSGRVLVNTTTTVTGEGYLQVKGSTNLSAWQVNSNGLVALRFFNSSGSGVGGITVNASGTVYATSSDYRLKENAVAISDGITRLKTLKPYRFNFIADNDADGNPTETVDGFFAHEVSSAVPEAITGTKDATETYTDDNGDEQTRIKPQGIDQAKLVPLLTSALQEAITKIETLETRIEALENA